MTGTKAALQRVSMSTDKPILPQVFQEICLDPLPGYIFMILRTILISPVLIGCAFLIGPCSRIPLEVNRLTTGPKVDTLARGRIWPDGASHWLQKGDAPRTGLNLEVYAGGCHILQEKKT